MTFPDTAHGWAAGDTDVLATGDGGAHWAFQLWRTAYWPNAVMFRDATHGWAVGWDGTILAYTGSLNWTSISVGTSAGSMSIGKITVLSGQVSPWFMLGNNIVVYVMKPGSARWSYSSMRTVYLRDDGPAWQYKYRFKPGMAKGLYRFKAVVPARPGFLASTSPVRSIRLR